MVFRRIIVVLLVLSLVTLALMIPGGFVETRSFARYPIWVLAGFNIVLTALGLGSLILAYRGYVQRRLGMWPCIAGAGFVAVYLLDLAHIFPISDNPMSKALISLEWLGTGLGLALVFVGWRSSLSGENYRGVKQGFSWFMFAALALVALGIVIFATWSAV